eukprot:scaffold3867_cov254-Pinguiococcus_pyrenoidosus.AAC.6
MFALEGRRVQLKAHGGRREVLSALFLNDILVHRPLRQDALEHRGPTVLVKELPGDIRHSASCRRLRVLAERLADFSGENALTTAFRDQHFVGLNSTKRVQSCAVAVVVNGGEHGERRTRGSGHDRDARFASAVLRDARNHQILHISVLLAEWHQSSSRGQPSSPVFERICAGNRSHRSLNGTSYSIVAFLFNINLYNRKSRKRHTFEISTSERLIG